MALPPVRLVQWIHPLSRADHRQVAPARGTSSPSPWGFECVPASGFRTRICDALLDQTIDGQRPGTTQYKRRKTGEIQKVGFISGLSKLRTRSRHRHQLDRAEAVRQMHGKYRYQQDRSHRYAGRRHESPYGYCQTAEYFDQHGDPCREVWSGHAQVMQDHGERLRAPGEFGKTMFNEAVPDDE